MLGSLAANNPSREHNRHAECAGGGSHGAVESDQRRIEAPGDGEME
ncbi:MAG: hypothetical protein ACREET_16410 [Stellaceae bacterium]